jgi:hypothetical protein
MSQVLDQQWRRLCVTCWLVRRVVNKGTTEEEWCMCIKTFVRGCIQKFPDWVISKYTLTTMNTRWEATQKVIAAKLTRLTQKIAICQHLVAKSCTICNYRSRRSVRKLLDTLSYSEHILPKWQFIRHKSHADWFRSEKPATRLERHVQALLMFMSNCEMNYTYINKRHNKWQLPCTSF